MQLLKKMAMLNKKTYTAIHLSGNDDHDYTKSGFLSEQAAEHYIALALCKGCREDIVIDNETILGTACGCEWGIADDKEFEESKSASDVFKAAGFTRIVNPIVGDGDRLESG